MEKWLYRRWWYEITVHSFNYAVEFYKKSIFGTFIHTLLGNTTTSETLVKDMAAYIEGKFGITENMTFDIMNIIVLMSSKDAEATSRLMLS